MRKAVVPHVYTATPQRFPGAYIGTFASKCTVSLPTQGCRRVIQDRFPLQYEDVHGALETRLHGAQQQECGVREDDARSTEQPSVRLLLLTGHLPTALALTIAALGSVPLGVILVVLATIVLLPEDAHLCYCYCCCILLL